MERISWKLLALLVPLGIAIGFGAAELVEATDWHPLVAPAISIAAVAATAFALRKRELMNFLFEAAVFAYSTYIGIGLVRASITHNYLAAKLGDWDMMHYGPKALLDGLNPVVIAAGIPYAFFAVLIFGLPAWAFAQYLYNRTLQRNDRFWEFVKEQNRR
jgi:hypothetical protein